MNTISIIRGDSHSICISLMNEDNLLPFEKGSKVYFTVKRNTRTKEKAIQKIMTEFDEGKAVVELAADDTKEIDFGDYVYDIQLTYVDGTVVTLVPPSRFTIKEEVTYE